MKNIIQPILVFFLVNNLALGQTSAAFEKAADNYLGAGNYYGAMVTYAKLLAIDRSDAKGWSGYAEAAYLQGAFEESEAAYQRIFDGRTKIKSPLATYWLAGAKQVQGRYREASELYAQFIAAPGTADPGYLGLAKEAMTRCDYAEKHQGQIDMDVAITKLPEPINSPEGEYSPTLVGDMLYFASNREEWEGDKHYPKRAIYKVFSGKMSDNGSEISKTDFNETDLHTANGAFSTDGHWMYYSVGSYKTDAIIESKIWRREKLFDGTWGNPTMLPEPINSPIGHTTTEPNFGVDATGNDVLFFASNREGGTGGMDIYKVTVAKDGTYTIPENLIGINTIGDEITPNWHRKTNTLYYSSNGRPTLGGYDIFKSEAKNGTWGASVHLTPPTNSHYNDAYYSILPDESGALFASNRREATKQIEALTVCCYDIFKVEFLGIDLVAITFHNVTKDSLRQTTIRLVELVDGKKPGDEIKLDVAGSFAHFPIEREKYYMLIATKPDFTSDTNFFNTVKLPRTQRSLKEELFLQPAQIDLMAYCFNQKTGLALEGTTMRFEEIIGGARSETNTNEKGNSYFYPLDFGRKYRLIVTKFGFIGDTVEVSTQGYDRLQTVHLSEKLYLRPALTEYLPLAVFFDNDEPDKDVNRPTTTTSYGQSYDRYHDPRKPVFVATWNKANPAMNQAQYLGQMTMEQFFEDRVKAGFNKLQLLSAALKERLDAGEYVQLTLQGYASPRAQNQYNTNLTGRRVWSLKNHFSVWNNGALAAYIENQKLTFTEVTNGEEQSPKDIIDLISDETNSIYSIRASFERRVEIIEVNVSQQPMQQNGK